MIQLLLKYRKKEPIGSLSWLKIWLKRIYSFPDLFTLFSSRLLLQFRGATIGHFSDISCANIQGRLALLSIGSYSFVGRADILLHGHLRIHSNVVINDHVKLLTGSHDIESSNFANTKASIVIHDYAWICTGSIILPGVTIGKGSVVAAGSVVTHDVSPFTVVGGSPAKFIKKRHNQDLFYHPNLLRACYECWVDSSSFLP